MTVSQRRSGSRHSTAGADTNARRSTGSRDGPAEGPSTTGRHLTRLKHPEGVPWGNDLTDKSNHTIRFYFQNINGYHHSIRGYKDDDVRQTIEDNRIDVFGMSEVGINWSKLPVRDRFRRRSWMWFENQSGATGHNRNERTRSIVQPGGTAIFSRGNLACRVIDYSWDPTNLGRWVCVRYRGRRSNTLAVFSVYRPCESVGETTTCMQQTRFLVSSADLRPPRQALLEDLATAVSNRQEAGDHIVVGGDFNDDFRHEPICSWAQDLNLRPAIPQHKRATAPPTLDWGRKSLDSIFVSSDLNVEGFGYDVFGGRISSDHRGVWCDITFASALGCHLLPVVRPRARRLKCDDPRSVAAYVGIFGRKAMSLNLIDRAHSLQQRCHSPLTSAEAAEYEDLDADYYRSAMTAEHGCRKLRMGKVPWSLGLCHAGRILHLWSTIQRQRLGANISRHVTHRLASKAGIERPWLLSDTAIVQQYREAWRQYHDVKRVAPACRATWIEQLAAAKAAAGNTTKAAELRALHAREEQRETFRAIRSINDTADRSALSSVIGPLNGIVQEVSTKDDLERVALAENNQRFHQAGDTPFMTDPLLSDFGYRGNQPAIASVLCGTYQAPAGVDPYSKMLLHAMKTDITTSHATPYEPWYSTASWQSFWLRCKERVSAGANGFHFGQLKAAATNNRLASLSATMANIPYATGYSPHRWQRTTNIMIEKTMGDFWVERLRTICLFDADANANNKRLGREILARGEQLGLLAVEQYGSRKGFTAIEHAFNKRLTFDLFRQLRRPGVLCSNDAKSCYDRIVHQVANMAIQRLGMPPAPIQSMLETIQDFRHHIRTTFGDSDISFGHTYIPGGPPPPQGICQGNGAGPAIWVAVNSPIYNALRAQGFGIRATTAISNREFVLLGFAFVDDADNVEMANANESISKVVARMQASLDCYGGLLWATGGALAPDKSFWYPVDFTWRGGQYSYRQFRTNEFSLEATDRNGARSRLTQYPTSKGRQTLGVRLAPDGSNTDEFLFRRLQVQTWAKRLQRGCLTRSQAWLAFHSTISRSLLYPLAATTFTQKQCHTILAPAKAAWLPAIGVQRSFPGAVLHAPGRTLGLAVPDLWVEQGIAHCKMAISHGGTGSTTGNLLDLSFENAKIEIGLPGSVTGHCFRTLGPLLTTSWVSSLWSFVSEYDMRMEDTCPNPCLRSFADRFLTELAVTAGLQGKALKAFNRCRLHLQVMSLADIVCGNGLEIIPAAYNGARFSPRFGPSPYGWPRQPRPPPSDWIQWQRAIDTVCLDGCNTLVTRLGRWFEKEVPSAFCFCPTENRLYVREGSAWRYYLAVTGRSRSSRRFRRQSICADCPVGCVIAECVKKGDELHCFGRRPFVPTNPPSSDTFPHRIASLPASAHWAVANWSMDGSLVDVVQSIQDGTAYGVSDGSFKCNISTSAWQITNGHWLVKGTNALPGLECHSAYRGKLGGLFAMLQFLCSLCLHFNITKGNIRLSCDGQEALNRSSGLWRFNPDNADYGLLCAISSLRQSCPLTLDFQHVLGHQDLLNRPLNIYEALNVDCDSDAKHRLSEELSTRSRAPQTLAHEGWRLWLGRRKVEGRLSNTVRLHCLEEPCLRYWERKFDFNPSIIEDTDWDALEKAASMSSIHHRIWASKHATGCCDVGHRRALWYPGSSPVCPRCGMHEDSVHVTFCGARSAKGRWQASLNLLDAWMSRSKTMPMLQKIIIQRLSTWRSGSRYATQYSRPDLSALNTELIQRGRRAFISGFLPCSVQAVQNRHFLAIDSQKSSLRWTAALIRKLWEVAWHMWDDRNVILHETDNFCTRADKITLLGNIRCQLGLGTAGLLPSERPFLTSMTLESAESWSVDSLATWLSTIRSMRNRTP